MTLNSAGGDSRRPRRADRNTRRLTLLLSGAISLGAYEAGVVSQIAYALARWDEGRGPDEAPLAVIDVVAGASAGAMTGAMLAAHLIRGGDPVGFVRLNHDQWCGTTFDRLLDPDKVDPHAVLSARDIDGKGEGQGRWYFDRVAAGPGDPRRVRQDELIYTCTLTSLDPIPYRFPIDAEPGSSAPGDESMTGLTRRDFLTFSLAPEGEAGDGEGGGDGGPRVDPVDTVVEVPPGAKRGDGRARPADWGRLFGAAVASGAFPVAWEPVRMSRRNADYPPPWKEQPGWGRLRYADGGVLNNMPLQRASEALEALQLGTRPDEDRVYVLIEPAPDAAKVGTHGFGFAGWERDADTRTLGVLGAVYEALREQSFYADVLESQKINRRLAARAAFVPRLVADAVRKLSDAEAAEREASARATLGEYLRGRVSGAGLSEAQVKARVDAVIAEYRREYRGEATRPEGERALHDAVDGANMDEGHPRFGLFLLQLALADHVAGLQDKCPITFLRIHPDEPHALAGETLGHFGGFLSRAFLHHDFARGLDDAWVRLNAMARHKDWPDPARVLDELPEYQPDEATVALARREYKELPRELREPFTDALIERLLTFLGGEANFPSLQGGPVRAMLRAYLDHYVFA